jgi:hypothetical protein
MTEIAIVPISKHKTITRHSTKTFLITNINSLRFGNLLQSKYNANIDNNLYNSK